MQEKANWKYWRAMALDAVAVLVAMVLLAAFFIVGVVLLTAPAHAAGCEAPKAKRVQVAKPRMVCTCTPAKRKPVKRKALAKPAQPVCPEPQREVPSASGAGGGGGLRLVPFTLPAPVVLAERAQEPLMVVQATQVPDEPQSWRGGPILIPPGPLSMFEPLPVVFVPVPAVPEPHGLALFGVGLVVLWGVRKCKK